MIQVIKLQRTGCVGHVRATHTEDRMCGACATHTKDRMCGACACHTYRQDVWGMCVPHTQRTGCVGHVRATHTEDRMCGACATYTEIKMHTGFW